ncbi:MAG: hypothetical protein H6599_03040 [Flavobacteriales bacterium]|nr:hypothetical protein [Flavobacteriales bacterium]
MRVILLLIAFLFSTLLIKAQEADPDQKEFVQFIMTDLNSKDKAIEIDNFYRAQKGVFMSRADLNSKKFLVIYFTNSEISKEQILNWMTDLDMDYKCVRHGIHGVDSIIDQKMDCE